MKRAGLIAALLVQSLASSQEKPKTAWSEFGGGPRHANSYDGKMPAELALAWKKPMGCPMPGRAQFVAGGGLLFGSSP
jgi:hypothetical protein